MKQSHRRLAGVALIAALSLAATGTTRAQAVVKVSPEAHKVLLENEHFRVLDFYVKPGEKVGMHSHPAAR